MTLEMLVATIERQCIEWRGELSRIRNGRYIDQLNARRVENNLTTLGATCIQIIRDMSLTEHDSNGLA